MATAAAVRAIVAGDMFEFDIDPDHWDNLVGQTDTVSVDLGNLEVKVKGHLVELLDRPRILIEVDEAYSIH